ncbi:MAG: hypothetical protein ABSC19_14050 [Syntrophorhabdales bacterium]|jgi:hypothetical protein
MGKLRGCTWQVQYTIRFLKLTGEKSQKQQFPVSPSPPPGDFFVSRLLSKPEVQAVGNLEGLVHDESELVRKDLRTAGACAIRLLKM